ncbi:GntP family permease [Thermaerobacter sp. PB12/4term]|uniref:GntP family permease n=1 Tax=Thermaerobacter sp. PB12/4term TaxID=2293838 RepID=UPI000E326F57|nr:GntP family permease [Thermaerobacter sp. PB12/4term]QIA27801.1 GntP family permease [Thermaerobacter sp. PB12/4term]
MHGDGTQMVLGLVLGVAVLIFLVLRTKIHTFLALIAAAALTGLVGGMAPGDLAQAITQGFGNTLASIGIVIGFGVMLGRILEVTGAAQRMALTFLRLFGRGREEWALGATGAVVSIPIFCDSGFVILSPLARALAREAGKPVLGLGVALAAGLMATHHLVPPTPGPLAAAGTFGVDMGLMIFWGLVIALPVYVVTMLYARWIGRWAAARGITVEHGTAARAAGSRAQAAPAGMAPITGGSGAEAAAGTAAGWGSGLAGTGGDNGLLSAWRAFAPIVVPVLLIFLNTTLTALQAQGTLASYLIFLGHPVIAVAIGLLLAVYGLMGRAPREEVLQRVEEGVASAGIIILVTGAGGALGNVLRASGTGDFIAQQIAQMPLPPLLLPFLVATLVRLVQGSGTVAMVTAASITAPILASLDVAPVMAAQAAAVGSMVFSYFNDSYFWVINRTLGITDVKTQILTWSVPSTLGWLTGLVTLLVVNGLFF